MAELADALNLKDLREQLATTERTRKQKDLGRDELQTLWNSQLTKSECESLDQLRNMPEKALANDKSVIRLTFHKSLKLYRCQYPFGLLQRKNWVLPEADCKLHVRNLSSCILLITRI